ncbi:MAG: hypothetical protein OFPII_44270 [Osedax symbiont Rs1]|nr:MAG: hypothetical protein OFPII_44270 [Osedax symbiont Rs1]
MKILKNHEFFQYHIAIFGLGYESRSTHVFKKNHQKCNRCIVLGYDTNTDKFNYKKNKQIFLNQNCNIIEDNDDKTSTDFISILNELNFTDPINILIDITVMTRHRLAFIIWNILEKLPKGSIVDIKYSLSKYISPPQESTPVKKIGEIIKPLTGGLGDLSKPSVLVMGLGYEKNKALGVANYLDLGNVFIFIPKSPQNDFEAQVVQQNEDLLSTLPENHIFKYDVKSPYSTYLDLKSLITGLSITSRPLLLPLGPKILAAISVVLGKELSPSLPVWRVSSEHSEQAVERAATDDDINFIIEI